MAKVKEIYLGEKLSEGNIKIKALENNDKSIKKKLIEKVMGSTMDGYKVSEDGRPSIIDFCF